MADFEKYTVGWVCALFTEFTAAKVMHDETHPNVRSVPPRDSNGYVLGKIGSHNVVIAVLPDSEYGLSSAANVATNMLNMFPNIRIGLLVGIGGGAPTSQKDIRLGDVAVSSIGHGTGGVFQYDYGRTVQNQEFQTTGFLSQPPTVLRVAISAIRSEHEMNGHHIQDSIHDGLQRYPRLKKKYSRPPTVNDRLYLSSVVHPFKDHRSCDEVCGEGTMDEPKLVKRHKRSEENDDPEIHYGIIASGNQLMKDAHVRDKLSSERGIVCFEMEAAGLLNNFPCVVIRGICDYADTHKNDEWQGYAAMTAAAYAKELLKQVSVTRIQEERRISDVLCDLHTTIKSISSRVQGQGQVLSQIKDRAEMHQDRATIDRLPYVKEATFDSHNEDQNPTCLENTRVDLLAQISAWVEDADSKTVFWLNGMAGTGKSTISRTVTRSLSTTGKLGASFFFKRGEADQGSAAKLCTTMARQMAVNNACFGSLLRSAIDKDPEIGSKGMRIQFEKLILQPLSNMPKQQSVDMTTIAIVVDALDECNSERDIKLLISLFSQAGKLSNVRLRVFLTSRPELPIRLTFNSVLGTFQDLILHEIPAPIIRHDISVFFQHQLKNILLEWNSSVAEHRRLPEIWPDEDDIQTLIDQAVPLFIFAATMCRFIADGNSGPRTRLREILQYATWKDADKMQATYAPVLDQLLVGLSPADRKVALDEFKLIVGTIIILESPLSAMVLSRLLGISQDRVDDRLDKLHSVLDVPKSPEVPIRLFHLSFRDYLIDGKYPDNEFRIDQKEASRRLSTNCLRVMRTYLKTDICNLRHPGTERVNISGQLVDSCLPPELQYACLYWVKHQQGSDVKLDDIQLIMEFIKTHLLHWIEALVLMNRSWEISGLFKILRGLLKHNSSSFEFLSDALQFINYSISTVDTQPLQLYPHGLVFAPQNSLVKSNFEAQMPMWIKQAPSTGSDWDTRLHIFMKPDYHVFHSMSFIPESTLLFVSLESGSFDILDWDTGECLHEFRNISKLCAAVLSPDGKFIAAPSCENRIEIRDSLTSEILFKFPGRCDIDVELLFSPNSRLIAVSGEGTIHIWDWASSTHLYRLEKRHSGVKRINRIAFSADSVLVMSSSDLEIAIWNCQTGDCIFKWSLKHHSQAYSMFTPNGRMFIFPSASRDLQVWSTDTFERIYQIPLRKTLHPGTEIISISPDSNLLAVTSRGAPIDLWSLPTGQHVSAVEVHNRLSSPVFLFTPDSRYLAFSSNAGYISIWCTSTKRTVDVLQSGQGHLGSISFSSDGAIIASKSIYSTEIRLWERERGATSSRVELDLDKKGGTPHKIKDIQPSPDLTKVAVQTTTKFASLFDITFGSLVRLFDLGGKEVTDIRSFSKNSTFLIVELKDCGVSVLDICTSACIWESSRENEYVTVSFSDDSQWLAALTTPKDPTKLLRECDSYISIWQHVSNSFELKHMLKNLGYGPIVNVAFSASAKFVAAFAQKVGKVIVWNLQKSLAQPLVIESCSSIIAISETWLAVSDLVENRVHIWDVETGQYYLKLEETSMRGAFSLSGELLGLEHGELVIIFSCRTGDRLAQISGLLPAKGWGGKLSERWKPPFSFLPNDAGIQTKLGKVVFPSGILAQLIPPSPPLDITFAPHLL